MRPDITWIVGIILTILFTIGLAYAALRAWTWIPKDDFDNPIQIGTKWILSVLACLPLTVWLLGTWPTLNMDYHAWHPVSATVLEVQPRLLEQTTVYAYRLDNGLDIRCEDTRCALAHPGDHVDLWCIRSWQGAAVPGWICNVRRIGS